MQNNYSDFRTQSRPMQKSMYIPEQSMTMRHHQVEYNHHTPLQRSTVGNSQGVQAASLLGNNYQANQAYLSSNQNKMHSFNTQPIKDTKYDSSNLNASDRKLNELVEKIDSLTFRVEKHDLLLQEKKHENPAKLDAGMMESVITELKDKHLPAILAKNSKQLYQHVFNYTLELQKFKQQVNSIKTTVKTLELSSQQHQLKLTDLLSTQSTKTVNSRLYDSRSNETEIKEISGRCLQLQNSFNEMQKTLRQRDQYLKQYVNETLRSHQESKMKVGPVHSSLGSILLEYTEMFKVKDSTGRVKKEIEISKNLYYVDAEGNLIDHQNRLLIDQQGNNIKLQQKHINLLKEKNVLF